MDIYDYVTADTLGEVDNEQIAYNNDYIEVRKVVKETDTVMVSGYSQITGDSVTYFLDYDAEVGLWAV